MYQHPTQPFPPMPSSAFPQGPPKQQSAHPQEPVMNGHPQQFMPPGHHSHQPSVQSVTSDMGRMHMNGPAQAQPTMPPSLPVQQAAPNSVSHYEQPPPVPVPQSQVQHMQPMTQPQPQQPPQSYHPGPPFSTSARPTGHAPPPVPVSSHMSAPGAPPPARPAPIQSYGGPPPVPYSQPPTQAPQPPVVSQSIPPPGAIPGQVQMRPPAPMTSPNVAPAAHQPFPMSQAAVQQQPYHQQPVHQQRPPQVGGPGFPPQAPASVASQPPAFPQRPPVAQLPPVPGQMQGMPQPTATSQFQGGTASPGQLPPLPVPPMPGQGQRPGMPAPSGPMGHPGFHQPAHAGLPPGLPPQPGFQQQAGYPPQGPGQAGYPPGVSQQMGGGMPAGPPMPGMQQQHAMTGGYGPQMTGPPGAPMGMAQPQQQRKLDARMMPSVVQVMKDDRATRSGPFPTGYPFAESPPLVTTDFFCEDQGNASPRFMRCSLYNMPANQDLVKQSLIPIVAAVTPFAERHPNEVFPLPVIDLGDLGPVRCNRCKAYMNPFMEFFDGGRRFKCPFCHGTTEVPEQYFAHLDQTGRRVDIAERPELTRGSYELVATKEYCKGNLYPKKPVFMFMIDVSYNAVKSGLVSLFCQNVKQLLKRLPKEETANESAIEVAFVTYDQSLHFYNLKSCVGLPQMLVVGDVGDVFVPIADGLFVSPVEAEAAIDSLMTEIPKMFSETKVVEVVLGPVVQAGLDALKASDRSGKLFITHEASDRSGKLFILHSTLPIMDAPGKLQSRDERSLLGTEKEKQVLSPNKNQAEFYSSLSKACVEAGCCVDVFVTPNNYVDVATIGTMCAATGGSLYRYQYFQAERDGERLLRDLDHDISRPIAFDAVMRVRCSEGIRPTDFFGNLFMDNTTDVQLAAVDCDKCVTVQIKHDDKLPEDGGAYIQAALLYTSVSGQRRLRIHNLALKVGTDLVSLYKTADLECIMNFFLKQAEQLTLSKSAREMRESMISRCAQMLATYRTKCAHESAVGQLILPEAMKLLPLYMNCLIKHDAFTGGSEMTSDDRAILMQYIPPLTIGEAIGYLYPRLTPLIELEKENATEAAASPEDVEQLRCSSENLDSAGAYILENGLNVFVWIGSNVPREWLTEVFNVDSHANVDEDMRSVPLLNNTTSQKVHKLLQRVQSERHRFMKKVHKLLQRVQSERHRFMKARLLLSSLPLLNNTTSQKVHKLLQRVHSERHRFMKVRLLLSSLPLLNNTTSQKVHKLLQRVQSERHRFMKVRLLLSSLPLLNNTTSQKVHKLLQRVQSERHRFMKVRLLLSSLPLLNNTTSQKVHKLLQRVQSERHRFMKVRLLLSSLPLLNNTTSQKVHKLLQRVQSERHRFMKVRLLLSSLPLLNNTTSQKVHKLLQRVQSERHRFMKVRLLLSSLPLLNNTTSQKVHKLLQRVQSERHRFMKVRLLLSSLPLLNNTTSQKVHKLLQRVQSERHRFMKVRLLLSSLPLLNNTTSQKVHKLLQRVQSERHRFMKVRLLLSSLPLLNNTTSQKVHKLLQRVQSERHRFMKVRLLLSSLPLLNNTTSQKVHKLLQRVQSERHRFMKVRLLLSSLPLLNNTTSQKVHKLLQRVQSERHRFMKVRLLLSSLPLLNNTTSQKVHKLLQRVQSERHRFMKVRLLLSSLPLLNNTTSQKVHKLLQRVQSERHRFMKVRLLLSSLPLLNNTTSQKVHKLLQRVQSERHRFMKVRLLLSSLPLLNNTTSQKVHKLLQRVQSERHRFMKLMVVKQGGKLEAWFKKFLVEDQAMGSAHGPQPSYVEFLCHIHKEIKELIN